MDTSHDKVILTTEERRILAALEEATGHQALRRRLSLTVPACANWVRSSRMRPVAVVLLFLAGAALMVATFTHWPAVALIGVAALTGAVWSGLTVLAPHIGARVSHRTGRSSSGHRTAPPR